MEASARQVNRPAQRLHDLPGSGLGVREILRRLAAQEELWFGEPGSSTGTQSFLHALGEPDDAEEPVGLVSFEKALTLAALQGAWWHRDGTCKDVW